MSRSTYSRSTRVRRRASGMPMPAPRSSSAPRDRSYIDTLHPAWRSAIAAAHAAREPPTMPTFTSASISRCWDHADRESCASWITHRRRSGQRRCPARLDRSRRGAQYRYRRDSLTIRRMSPMSPVAIPRPAASASAVLDHIRPGTDLIVEAATGEPVTVLDAIEAAAGQLERVLVHQALAVYDRRYHAGAFGYRLRHLSYFLTPKLREHFERGTVELVPNDLSSIPSILRARTKDPLLLVSTSLPDRHGYVSLGTNANYAAALKSDVRLFIEA